MFESLSRFFYNSGLRLAGENQISEAVQNLVKAVSYNSDNTEAWNLAGLCYYRLGKYKTAEYCWKQSVNKRREGNAANDFLEDLRISQAETAPYFSQVASLCQQRKYGYAAGIVSKEICTRFDLSVGLLNFLGVLRMLDGKTKEAVKCWTTVLNMDKSNADADLYLTNMENRLSYRLLKLLDRLYKRE